MAKEIMNAFSWLDRALKYRPLILGLTALLVWLTKPYWSPYAVLPTQMQEIQESLAELHERLDWFQPHLFEYTGGAQISPTSTTAAPKFDAGTSFEVTYRLKKVADCDAEVYEEFYNVDKGRVTFSRLVPAKYIPKSPEFSNATIEIEIPHHLDAGEYIYSPRIIPIDCSGYGAVTPPSSDIFEVVSVSR